MRTAYDLRLTWSEGEQDPEAPLVRPMLPPRGEAIVLLQAVAEVEHALMVQYLYAAYSLRTADEVPQDKAAVVEKWRRILLGIAREEMGHLLTVQNALRFLGGATNLERQGYPFQSGLYPFPFSLEPVSRHSVAKYVIAEMPERPDADLSDVYAALAESATTPQTSPHRIGRLYVRVIRLLEQIDESECRTDPSYLEGLDRLWRGSESILIPRIVSLADARTALNLIAAQGEGLEQKDALPSHFERLLRLFREMKAADWLFARAVPVDPTLDGDPSSSSALGLITHPTARAWAQMVNLRYGLLIAYIGHALSLDSTAIVSAEAKAMRGLLVDLAFQEMHWVATIAITLTGLPRRRDDESERAAPTFDLPITLDLPEREVELWRAHRDILQAARDLGAQLARLDPGAPDRILDALAHADAAALAECERQISRWRDDPRAPAFIAGAGPAGLAAALVLASRQIPVRIFEASSLLGGKVNSHYAAGRSLEHGVHGWWMNYHNFDRLLEQAGLDLKEIFKDPDGSNIVLPDGRRTTLRRLPIDLPSPLFLIVQVLRSPFLGFADIVRAIRFFLHVLAFDHERDYLQYDAFTFQRLVDHCGVSAALQTFLLRPFILSFDFTTPDRVSAACGLSGIQFYVLPDQRSIYGRWSRRIPAVTVYEPLGRAIERAGGTVSRETAVLSLQINGARLRGVTVGAPRTEGGNEEVVTTMAMNAVPNEQYVRVTAPGTVLWVGRINGVLRALDARCPHMGCSVDWSTSAAAFICPCHGSRFDAAGAVAAGPSDRSLRALHTHEQGGVLMILDSAADALQPCADLILATDLEAAKRVLGASDGAPPKLLRDLNELDTCKVVVVRIWFSPAVGPTDEETVVAAEFPFINNFFYLNKFDLDIPAQGEVVEVQAYRVDAMIDKPDEELLDLALADIQVINPRLIKSQMTAYTVNRHVSLFTRYGPRQNIFRPTEKTEIEGLYLAGDWTRADYPVWMQERAVVSGVRAANAILRRRGLPAEPILRLAPERWPLRVARTVCRLLRRTWLGALPDSESRSSGIA